MTKPDSMRWEDYLSERDLSRGEAGERIQQAVEAGLDLEVAAEMSGVSRGYARSLTALARQRRIG